MMSDQPASREVSTTIDQSPDELATGYSNAETLGLRDTMQDVIMGYQKWAEQYPFAATTVETVALCTIRKVIERLAHKKFGVNIGNALTDDHKQYASAHPAKAFVKAMVVAPIVEETLFRGILAVPSRLLRQQNREAAVHTLNTIVQLGFAAGHAGVIKPAESWTRPPFLRVYPNDHQSVPVSQFIGGLHYERLSRKRGLGHAIGAHVVNNAMATALVVPSILVNRKIQPS